eukprot:tig00000402_g187.t1
MAYDYTEGPPVDVTEEDVPEVMDEATLERLAREGKSAPGVKEVKEEIEETPWRSVQDPRTGQFYFWNAKTNETTWTNPLKKNEEPDPHAAYAAYYQGYYQQQHYAGGDQQQHHGSHSHSPLPAVAASSSGANSVPVAGTSASPPPAAAAAAVSADSLSKLDSILNQIETKVKAELGHTNAEDVPPAPEEDDDADQNGGEAGAQHQHGAQDPNAEYSQKFPSWKAEFYSTEARDRRQMGYYFDYEQWVQSKNEAMLGGKRKKPNQNDMENFRQKKEERRLKKIAKWLAD